MLPPVTKRCEDRSTDRFFKFLFFCDQCGGVWESETYPFSMRDAPAGSPGEQRARNILWSAEHDAGYERANNEALLQFNRCPACGRRVCDSCFSELGAVCLSCEKEKQQPRRH